MPSMKSIVIVGASSGFGAAFARALADDGHQLFICARRTDLLARVAGGSSSIFCDHCDVSDGPQVENYFRKVAARTEHVDVLIYCAARLGPIGKFDEVRSEDWLSTVTVNVFGAYAAARHVVPLMKSERRPRILMISGKGAFDPMPNASAYGVSKAALVRLVETLAVELAPKNIAVNAIAPGFAPTDIHKATLAAGPERGGEHYHETKKQLSDWIGSMAGAVDCVRYMISDRSAPLTGKTISARFDLWGEPEFDRMIKEISASRLYSTERITAEHIGSSELKNALGAAGDRKKAGLENTDLPRREK
jgi:NAD(P)-dependent dehydrogenase (short-subunit alcohol dehydrogenase family)